MKKEHPQLNVVYVWLTSEKPTIKEGDCLCLPCVKQIQRNYNKPKYIPQWLPKAECEKKCSIESCRALVETTTSQMTVNELEDILHDKFALLQCQLVPQNNLLDSVKNTTTRCIQYLTKKHHAIPVVHNQGKEK